MRRRVSQGIGITLLLPLIIPLVLIGIGLYWAHRLLLYILVWCIWLPEGKDALVVYSDSPIWGEYMTQEILPLLGERAVVLNWSERRRWPKWSLSVHVFRAFAAGKEFNPLVIVFRPFHAAAIFRFWSAFKEWKRGRPFAVDSLRRELSQYIG